MAWNDDERAPEVSPFSVAKHGRRRMGNDRDDMEWSLAKICKLIVKESADPYKTMPTPLPEDTTTDDAFDEPYYCAKSPSTQSLGTLSEDELEESVSSSSGEDDNDAPAGDSPPRAEDAEAVDKSAEPKPFFYT